MLYHIAHNLPCCGVVGVAFICLTLGLGVELFFLRGNRLTEVPMTTAIQQNATSTSILGTMDLTFNVLLIIREMTLVKKV